MRRIYESRALHRDDDETFVPAERDEASRSAIDWEAASHALLPVALRRRAIEIEIEAPEEPRPVGEPIPFRVVVRNRLPFPVVLRTRSPVRWNWAVDGLVEGSRVDPGYPEEPTLFAFARSERKTFRKRWSGYVREADREWAPAERGEHALSAWIDVDAAAEKGLTAETTVRVR
jgi:hypothetical protein